MKLIIHTSSSDENFDGDINHALVDITPEYATLLLRRIASLQAQQALDRDAYEHLYWDCTPDWFDAYGLDDELGDSWEEPEYIEAPGDLDVTANRVRTECDRLVVANDGVMWKCYPKHCSVSILTREIPIKLLREIAASTSAEVCA